MEGAEGTKVREGCGKYYDGVEEYDGEWTADKMHGKGVCERVCVCACACV